MKKKKQNVTQCELCAYYDEDDDACMVSRDEDDVAEFLSQPYSQCKYFSMYDEYKIVRKQN